jgi:hypothetical protein
VLTIERPPGLAELYESLPFERVHAGMWRFGDLEVPRHVWGAVRHLNVWIEPISAGEWARLTQACGVGHTAAACEMRCSISGSSARPSVLRRLQIDARARSFMSMHAPDR